MKKGSCPKCGSSEVINECPLNNAFVDAVDLAVTVYKHPSAWVMKGVVESRLRAWVCGACGYTELYVKDPKKLIEAFREQQASGG